MNTYRISLLGRFCLQLPDQRLVYSFDTQKVQELFCFLLCHRERPHHRELLASLLWENKSTEQTRRYLRKALWQLQNVIHPDVPPDAQLLIVDSEWIQVNPNVNLRLDVAVLEDAYQRVRDTAGQAFTSEQARIVRAATDVCHGDFLEGCFQDWCLLQRARFQHMHLGLMDKMMRYCEAQGTFEEGIAYGQQILAYDRAREHTHRSLMRLFSLAGDRTGALRQYRLCATALLDELGVEPSQRTKRLHEQVLQEQWLPAPAPDPLPALPPAGSLVGQLRQLSNALTLVQTQMNQVIDDFETATG